MSYEKQVLQGKQRQKCGTNTPFDEIQKTKKECESRKAKCSEGREQNAEMQNARYQNASKKSRKAKRKEKEREREREREA